MTRATSESESENKSPGGAHGVPGGAGLRSIVVVATAIGLDGADGSVSVSFVLLRLVNSRTISYILLFPPYLFAEAR
jgi:hypothetical protein